MHASRWIHFQIIGMGIFGLHRGASVYRWTGHILGCLELGDAQIVRQNIRPGSLAHVPDDFRQWNQRDETLGELGTVRARRVPVFVDSSFRVGGRNCGAASGCGHPVVLGFGQNG